MGYGAVVHGRARVDFDQPGVEIGVDHVIDPENLVAIWSVFDIALRPDHRPAGDAFHLWLDLLIENVLASQILYYGK